MQKINKITQPFPEIFFLRTLGMTNHTQLKQHANNVFSVDM